MGEKLLGVKWIQNKTKISYSSSQAKPQAGSRGTIRNTGTTRPPPPFVAFVCSRVPCAADNVAKENGIKHSICMYISSVEVYRSFTFSSRHRRRCAANACRMEKPLTALLQADGSWISQRRP